MDNAGQYAGPAGAHDGGQHVQWQMQAEHYDPGSYATLGLSVATGVQPGGGGQGVAPGLQYQQFQYNAPGDAQVNGTAWHSYETAPFDVQRRPPGSSRSTSSSEKSVHSKRSLSTITPLSVSIEEPPSYDDPPGSAVDLRTPNAPFDDQDMVYAHDTASPIDGSGSSGGDHQDDGGKPMDGVLANGAYGYAALGASKAPTSNNFVSKLYHMINDPNAAQFITWTELGTSFVVSSVGEFSRTILGSHFKHNNFSSFVRQLNMYGFHKINRTPRAQRTTTDAQTWEFSHHKFLRGRPDLLDEIKRKALEPDPIVRQRVELPAEFASQLGRISDEYRAVVKDLQHERLKVERLTGVVKTLYDFISNSFPGQLSMPFPNDLLDSHPPIYVTSPPDAHAQSQFSLQAPSGYARPMTGHTLSPSSSPTSADFPPPQFASSTNSGQSSSGQAPVNGQGSSVSGQQPQRRPLVHRMSFDHGAGQTFGGAYQSSRRPGHDSAGPTLPSSPSAVSEAEYGHSPTTAPGVGPRIPKRQRTNDSAPSLEHPPELPQSMRKLSRARSDSAPLGYGLGSGSSWDVGRPRSGSTRRPAAPPLPDYTVSGMVGVGSMMNGMSSLGISPPSAPPQQQLSVMPSSQGVKDESMRGI